MRLNLLFLICCITALNFAHEEPETTEDFKFVTCGSIIKLKHVATGYRLHSHGVNYGSGSGQQSVTGYPDATDPNSYWIIKGAHGTKCPQGTVLKNGDVIRFEHASTQKFLHSHLQQSPLSKQQEVSAYVGDGGRGDTGDNWKVEISGGGLFSSVSADAPWKRTDQVRFVHVDTGKLLHSHNMKFGHPIPGQQEVSAVPTKTDKTLWVTEEGVYHAAKAPEKK